MRTTVSSSVLRVGGLFAGIGGFELGMRQAGLATAYLCEIDPHARLVLTSAFPDTELHEDVTKLKSSADVDVLTAGFPCKDLSQAGQLAGIKGKSSGLVDQVFRVVRESKHPPEWLVLENVPFMLRLHSGKAAEHVVSQFEDLGYTWAYRIIDTRAFGLPQRRRRVYFVASKRGDPRTVLCADDADETKYEDATRYACGFYWTEGNTGVGWAVNATPPLKGGSGLGIPSPPAVRRPRARDFVVPTIESAERLQGFEAGWTAPAVNGDPRPRVGDRWRLVGNAVSVPVAKWLGSRLLAPGACSAAEEQFSKSDRWPDAAWGRKGERHALVLSSWPKAEACTGLSSFLGSHVHPLSHGAASGFLKRARASGLKFVDDFLEDLDEYVKRTGA